MNNNDNFVFQDLFVEFQTCFNHAKLCEIRQKLGLYDSYGQV